MVKKSSTLLLEKSLQSYFYSLLEEFNSEILTPLPLEIIFYSSDVLDYYSDAEKFDSDKPLGIQLLEAEQTPRLQKRRALKAVGDKSLLLSSFYSDSIEKKIINKDYYIKLGKTAYSKLNDISPEHYDVPSFFSNLSSRFELLSALCLRLSLEVNSENEEEYELKLHEIEDRLSYLEKIVMKIDRKSKKAA